MNRLLKKALAAILALGVGAVVWAGGAWERTGMDSFRNYSVSGFQEVRNTTAADLEIEYGSDWAVEAFGAGSDIEDLVLKVNGRRLSIEYNNSFFGGLNRGPVRVRIRMPELRALTVAGSGNADIDSRVLFRSMEFVSSGTGNIEVAGSVDELAIRVSGTGAVNFDGVAENAALEISGSGSIRLEVDGGSVTANLGGSGSLELRGQAERADFSVSGSGTIAARDLEAQNARVAISGSGTVEIRVESRLVYLVSGSGDLFYGGNPPDVQGQVTGSGEARER